MLMFLSLAARDVGMAALITRALWFVFIGWWAGLLWFTVNMGLIFTIVLAPIGLVGIFKTWEIMTLRRDPTVVVREVQAERD